MSVLSTQIAAALGVLNTAAGQTIEYRLGTSGSWIALSGGFLEQTDPQVIGYDDHNRAVVAPARAMLRVPSGRVHLVGGLVAKGSQVRHTLGTSVTVWAVVGATHHDAVSVYELGRGVAQSTGDPRGAMPQ